MKPHLILGSGLALALVFSVGAQDKPAAAAAATAKAPDRAGLANDWLRAQSSDFQPWDLGGELRLRYDYKENAGDGSSASVDFMKVVPAAKFSSNDYLSWREKIHLGYTPVNWFNVYVEGRDAGSAGDDRKPPKGDDVFDMQQGWFKLGNPKAFPFTAKVGRQELAYGDERMIGRADWNNLGPRVFDAALVRFENPDVWVDAFTGRPVMIINHSFNLPNDYDWLSGGYASSKTLVPFQESQLYFLAHNVGAQSVPASNPAWVNRPSTPQDTYTTGLRFKSLPDRLGGWDYSVEAAAQFGDVLVGKARQTQQAYAVMTSAGYTWKQAWGAPRVGLGYDLFSGDSDPKDDHNGTFEPLFPTNHRPLGLMDLVGAKNIHDPRVNFTLKPVKTVVVSLEWQSFWLAETADYFYSDTGTARSGNGYGRHPQFSSYAGSEVDLDVTYTPKPWLVGRAGYGHFFVGDYVDASLAANGGAQDADWIYTQLSFTF